MTACSMLYILQSVQCSPVHKQPYSMVCFVQSNALPNLSSHIIYMQYSSLVQSSSCYSLTAAHPNFTHVYSTP